MADAVAVSEPDKTGAAQIEALAVEKPERGVIAAALALLAAGFGTAEPKFEIAHLTDQDWASVSDAMLAPIRVGRFFIHDSARRTDVPSGTIGLRIEFGGAFGTGRHESTQGCLHALASLARSKRVQSVLDFGCGNGILALAALKLWRARAVACDVDPESVRVARRTFARNGVAARARAGWADHPGRRFVRRSAPYDLIAANILARPLKTMARGLKTVLAPGGRIILSGVLREEGALVERHYRSLGLRRSGLCDIGVWRTIVMERPGRRPSSSLVPYRGRP